ncbi:MAG TPA: hypothetical protein VFC04_03690 [Actinomycetota bacterium]|nr:hypothetical protein [Actinomycetota bacterium]
MASILLVCTGNICRSPMAEGYLRTILAHRFGHRAPSVASAGTIARESAPVLEATAHAASELGVDVSAHRARRLRRGDVEAADVVLGMASEHRDAVLELCASASARAFTLKELVCLLERLPPAPGFVEDPREVLRVRVAEADRLRRNGYEPLESGDVADPMGLGLEAFRAVAAEIDVWCSRLVDGLFGAPEAAEVVGRGTGRRAGA